MSKLVNKLFFSQFIIVLIISSLGFAQNKDSLLNFRMEHFQDVLMSQGFRVDSIVVQGNKITEEEIIIRELTFHIADTVTNKIINYNRERIYSLGLFTKVDLFVYPGTEKNILVINVEESWYIYPIPVLNIRDNDWKKLSYGIYLVVKNFRGRNETVLAKAEFGYDPAFDLSYYKPSITSGSDFYLGTEFIFRSITNKSLIAEDLYGEVFVQKFITGNVVLGKRFGLYQRTNVKFNYNYVETPKYVQGINASDQRIDRYPSIGLEYSYDTRDLAQFPKAGILGSAYFEFKGLGFNDINYKVLKLDFREYRNIFDDLTAKWRFAARFTSGSSIPYYDYSFIGYNEKIRGNFNLIQEGNNSYIGSLELYYPIIKDFNISFDFIPVVPKELVSYRIGLYFSLFGDAGATKLSGDPISLNDFRSGYGIGLNLLVLPYNTLRFEVAFDEYQNTEFILGLGISF
jgi:outer membrane protein assembly factor BamA